MQRFSNVLKMDYYFRVADQVLRDALEASGAVIIEGPKWSGKTTTARQQAASVLELQDPDTRDAFLATAATKPSLLLEGATPRLIDEWQVAPVLWDAVRVAVDRREDLGQFILTGSNSVDKSQIMHSGTGRIASLKMYTMSLYESRESNGAISLANLFEDANANIDGVTSPMKVEDLIFAACRGGWPASLKPQKKSVQLQTAKNYFNSLCKNDISSIDGVSRSESTARAILKAYARNSSTLAKKTSLLADVVANNESLSMPTFDDYLTVFQRLFVIEDMEAWSPAIRSATSIRSSVKREFTDPSIAVSALGLTPEMLHLDMKTFGFLFETMCFRDLRVYSQSLGGRLSYYHDRYGLEADAVLHLDNGKFALIECKLGSREIDEGAQHLLEICRLIREHNQKPQQVPIREPDLLMVLTGGPMAYTRQDGVKIIPLATLKP